MRPHEVNELMIAIQKFKERMAELEELVGEENHGLLRMRMIGILEAIRRGPRRPSQPTSPW